MKSQFDDDVLRGQAQHLSASGDDPRASRSRVESCPHHDAMACCTECPDHRATDGRGFPHPTEAKGRRRLQRCQHCRMLVDSLSWVNDIKQAWFGCIDCHAKR